LASSNYFKTIDGSFFFFNEHFPISVSQAFRAALGGPDDPLPAIYSPVWIAGPWDQCPIVGHRPRKKVLKDLARTDEPGTIEQLHKELSAIENRFEAVGRRVPLETVAA